MNKNSPYYQVVDYYPRLINKHKYTGRRPLTIRSSWEKKFIKHFLDINNKVREWNSEDVVIKYYYRVDRKIHRYFVDFWVKIQESDGTLKEYLIEIKPLIKTQKPKVPQRRTKSYRYRLAEYIKNMDKFKAAEKFCEQLRERGKDIEFKVLTERELEIK